MYRPGKLQLPDVGGNVRRELKMTSKSSYENNREEERKLKEDIRKRANVITLSVDIIGEKVTALMDSGANCSLISDTWFDENLKSKGSTVIEDRDFIFDMNGNEIEIKGYVVGNINVCGIEIKNCAFYVKKSEKGREGLGRTTEQHCLLGMNILVVLFREWGIKNLINESDVGNEGTGFDNYMRMIGHNLRLWDEEELGLAMCMRKQDRTVPAKSRKMIKIYVDRLKNVPKEYVLLEEIEIERNNDLAPGVKIVPGFTVCEWGIGYACIANWMDQDMVIEDQARVAMVTLAVVETQRARRATERDQPSLEEIRKFRKELGIKINENLPADYISKVERIVYEYKDCFELGEGDLGLAKGWQHEIKVTNERPIKLPYRRIAPALLPEAKLLLANLKSEGVIEESCSPYAAPIVLVRKKNGGLRLCVDYRQLNKITVKDAFPLPRIAESLDMLSGAKYFSTFDMAQGYHQILVKEEDREKTAFSVPWGHYQYRRCPMGLTNSPATFQR